MKDWKTLYEKSLQSLQYDEEEEEERTVERTSFGFNPPPPATTYWSKINQTNLLSSNDLILQLKELTHLFIKHN